MSEEGPNCTAAQECRGDFWVMLEEALEQCHGCPSMALKSSTFLGIHTPAYADMPLRQVVEVLAQNGIRMVYIPEKHIDQLQR